MDEEFMRWHRASVSRLAMHANVICKRQPRTWRREIKSAWERYALHELLIFEEYVLGGIDRHSLLDRLDHLYSQVHP